MVMKSRRDTGGIRAPAITLAPKFPPSSWNGLKMNSSEGFDLIEKYCQDERVEDCIEKKTFNIEEAITDVILGFTDTKSLSIQKNLWTEDFTYSRAGRYYTLNISEKLGPNDETDQLFLCLNYGLNFRIYVHDPFYFILNDNPVGLQNEIIIINPNTSYSHFYRLAMTEVEELDVPDDPCNSDPDYNFQACVKGSLSSKVGCRTPWDQWSHRDKPLCKDIKQYR